MADISRRKFLVGAAAAAVAAPAAPEVTEYIVHGFDAYGGAVTETFCCGTVYRSIALGYSITRQAIDDNLYGKMFLPFDMVKTEEIYASPRPRKDQRE